jgi:hypothetical protein
MICATPSPLISCILSTLIKSFWFGYHLTLIVDVCGSVSMPLPVPPQTGQIVKFSNGEGPLTLYVLEERFVSGSK